MVVLIGCCVEMFVLVMGVYLFDVDVFIFFVWEMFLYEWFSLSFDIVG